MSDDPYSGVRVVGWGPFRLPGEKRRMRKAQEHADEMLRALAHLRGPDSPPVPEEEQQ